MNSDKQWKQGLLTLTSSQPMSLENFCVTENEQSLLLLSAWMNSKEPTVCWLTGVSASGKTHLANAWLNHLLLKNLSCGYFVGEDLLSYSPEVLRGFDHLDLLCIDNADVLLAHDIWLQALIVLSHRLRDTGAGLLLIQRDSVVPVALSGVVIVLKPVDGIELKQQILLNRANQLSINLSQPLVSWMLKNFGEDLAQLLHVLDYLDKASLTLKRPLTLPLAKQVLLQN